jgi:hypothetical protein
MLLAVLRSLQPFLCLRQLWVFHPRERLIWLIGKPYRRGRYRWCNYFIARLSILAQLMGERMHQEKAVYN